MSLYEDTKSAIDAIILEYKKVVADGKISISEVFTLVGRATATFVNLFRSLDLGTESERKDTVVLAIGRFYDEIVAPIDITGVPNFLEPIVDKALRELLLLLTRSWADAVLAVFTKSEIVVQRRASITLKSDEPTAPLEPADPSPTPCSKHFDDICNCPQGHCNRDDEAAAQNVQRIVEAARSAVVIY